MKRTFARFVLPLALLSVTALAQTSKASPAPDSTSGPAGTKLGIINVQQAIMLTNEGKRDLDALETKFTPKKNELQTLQTEIESMKKQLSTQGDKMNEEARNKLTRDIDTKQKSLQRSVEDAQQDFQQQQGEIVNRIGTKMMEVLDKYAKSNGYVAILDVSNPQSPVIWANQGTDVTKEIANAYNAQSTVPAQAPSAPVPHAGPKPTASTTK
jgi:outer membrane protein